MKKKIAGGVAVMAVVACAWAQQPGLGDPAQPGRPAIREQIRERIQQHMAGGAGGRQTPGQPGGIDRGEILKHVLQNPELAKRAGVSEEQIRKIKDGHYATEKQMIQLRADVQAAELEMRHLMDAEKTDRDAISKAFDTVAAKQTALRKAETMRMLDVKETLGKETLGKIQGMVREHFAQRMKQMQERGAPGMVRPQGLAPREGGARPWQQQQKQPPPPRGEPGV